MRFFRRLFRRFFGDEQEPRPNGRIKVKDVFVRRNAKGEFIPIEVVVPEMDNKIIKVLPGTIGSFKGLKTLDKLAIFWPIEEKIRYVKEHVVDPDFSNMTEEDMIEGMTLWDLDWLVAAAVEGGGPQRSELQKKKTRPAAVDT